MAFVANLNEKEEAGLSAQPNSPASGQIVTQAQGATGTPSAPTGSTGGSQFPDIGSYISKNKAASDRLAANVGQNIVNQGSQAQQGLNTAQNTYNQNVQDNTVQANQGVLDDATGNYGGLFDYTAPEPPPPPAQAVIPQAGQDSNKKADANRLIFNPDGMPDYNVGNYLAQEQYGDDEKKGPGDQEDDDDNKDKKVKPPKYVMPDIPAPDLPPTANQAAFDALGQMLNAEFQGPTNLANQEGFGDVSQAVVDASGLANQTGTQTGRADLLQGVYGDQGQRSGVSALDNLLLGGANSQNILNQSASPYSGLEDMLSTALTDAEATGLGGLDTTTATQQAAMDSIYGEGGYLGDLQGDYSDFMANQMEEKYRGRKETPEHYEHLLGLNAQTTQGQELDERLRAINELLGSDYTFEG